MKKVGIAGLGKLGLTWGLILASKGFEIHGVDINEKTIESLKNGELPIFEDGALDLFQKYNDKLNFYNKFSEVYVDLDFIFIVVPTPSLPNNCFDSAYVLRALKNIDSYLFNKANKTYTNVVITSTVMPGECERFFGLISKDFRNSINNEELGFCYNPEFIALGSVIQNMLNPDFILIGSNSKKASEKLSDLYKTVNGDNVVLKNMSIISAEITKISINTFLTLKISFANTIGLLSDQFEGAQKYDICDAIGSDTRIGKKFIKPGFGFGGPCLPRDTRAFGECLKNKGLTSQISDASAEVNKNVEDYFSKIVGNNINQLKVKNPRILYSGITYKKKSWLLEESHPFKIVLNNQRPDITIEIYDELATEIKKFSQLYKKYENIFNSIESDLNYLLSKKPNLIVLFNEITHEDYLHVEKYISANSDENRVKILDLYYYQSY